MFIQGCPWSHLPSDAKKFIYIGNESKVIVEGIGTFRLFLTTFHVNLFGTYVALSFRGNLISILDKASYSYPFGNNRVSLYYDSNVVGYGFLIDIECCYNETLQKDCHGMTCKLNENFTTL